MENKSTAGSFEALRRKLAFRSWHRGTREMDLLLGRFADAHLHAFSGDELNAYGELLQENDPDLYEWLTGKTEAPAHCQGPVMEKMITYFKGS